MAQECLTAIPWLYDPVATGSWNIHQKKKFAEEVSPEGSDARTNGIPFAWSSLDRDFPSGRDLRYTSPTASLSYMNSTRTSFKELLYNYDTFLRQSTVVYSRQNHSAFDLFASTS